MPMVEASFSIPRSRVHLTHRAMADELLAAVEAVLLSERPQAVKTLADFEQEFAGAVGRKYAFGVHSGTAGLFLALRACGVGRGDEVITVANSDISTTAAISHCGAIPVLCDIRSEDYNIDSQKVEDLISGRTRALLPVDLYGHPADVRTLREIADRHGLMVIEDAALALGAQDYGQAVGAFAHTVVFSFGVFKPLGCIGNGGMVSTDDEKIAYELELLRGYGSSPRFKDRRPGCMARVAEGYNLPLDPLEAAVLGVKLPYLSEWTRRRREIVGTYAEELEGTVSRVPTFRPESEPTFRSYTVRVPERDRVIAFLWEQGIEAHMHYVPPVHQQPVYHAGLPGADSLPITEEVAGELLCLPVTPELNLEEVARVVDALRDALERV